MRVDREVVKRLVGRGVPYTEIALIYGVSRQAVHAMAVRMGVDNEARCWRRTKSAEAKIAYQRRVADSRLLRKQATNCRLEEMSEAWKSGLPAHEVARAFGYGSTKAFLVVVAKLRRYNPRGLELFPRRRNNEDDLRKLASTAHALRAEGRTQQEVASEIHCCLNTTRKLLKKYSPRGEKQEG